MAHLAGQHAAGHDQLIRLVLVEAQCLRHSGGERRKATGDECRVRAIGLHGGDQRAAARHEADPFTEDRVDDPHVKSLQQLHALDQGALEVEFAAHGACGDLADVVADPRHHAELVDAFLLDHGRVHVGDQQLLAAVGDGHHIGIDGQGGDGFEERGAPSEVLNL